MSQVAGPLVSLVATRTDDAGATATARADVLLLLSHAQRILNNFYDRLRATVSVTLTPRRMWWPLSEWASDVLRFNHMTVDDVKLTRTSIAQLGFQKRDWLRDVAGQPYQVALVGRTHVVVHPAVNLDTTASVTYTKSTPTLTHEGDTLDLPDEDLPAVLMLTEALVHLRRRHLSQAKVAIEALGALEFPKTFHAQG